MSQFSIVGNGVDIEFALPSSITGPDAFFSPSYNTGALSGTVNGAPATVSAEFIFPGTCAVCDTLIVGRGGQGLNLGLPYLFSLSSPTSTTETLRFIPGLYTAITEYPRGGPTYTINVTTTQAPVATTPEPSSLWLVATATLGVARVGRRGFGSIARP